MEAQREELILADIEARYAEFTKLEASINELHDMYSEMAMLTESQVRCTLTHLSLTRYKSLFKTCVGKTNLGSSKENEFFFIFFRHLNNLHYPWSVVCLE